MARRGLDAGRVIAAAAAIADRDGLEAVTVARVAADLGVRAPSLYNHVAGVDGLRHGIALLSMTEMNAVLGAAARGRSGREAVQAVAGAYRVYALAHPGRNAAAVRAPGPGEDDLLEQAQITMDILRDVLGGFGLEGDDMVHAMRALRSAMHGFVDIERSGGFAMDVSVDASFERMVDDLAAGLAGQAAR